MSNSAGFVSDVNVVPFDVGHDIDDSGTDVEEGLGVDEGDVLLLDLSPLWLRPKPRPRPRDSPKTNMVARDPRTNQSFLFPILRFTCSSPGGFPIAVGGGPSNGILPSLAGVKEEKAGDEPVWYDCR